MATRTAEPRRRRAWNPATGGGPGGGLAAATTWLLLTAVTAAACAGTAGPRHSPAASSTSDRLSTWSRTEDGLPDYARTAGDILRCCVRSQHLLGARERGHVGAKNPLPLLVIDGTPASDHGWLAEMPAESVGEIRVLAPFRAVARFGPRAGSGAILIRTRRGPPLNAAP